VYADLDLDKYIEADLENESTIASDTEADGMVFILLFNVLANK